MGLATVLGLFLTAMASVPVTVLWLFLRRKGPYRWLVPTTLIVMWTLVLVGGLLDRFLMPLDFTGSMMGALPFWTYPLVVGLVVGLCRFGYGNATCATSLGLLCLAGVASLLLPPGLSGEMVRRCRENMDPEHGAVWSGYNLQNKSPEETGASCPCGPKAYRFLWTETPDGKRQPAMLVCPNNHARTLPPLWMVSDLDSVRPFQQNSEESLSPGAGQASGHSGGVGRP